MSYYEAAQYVGYSHQHLRRLVNEGKFPDPVKISPQRQVFRGEDVRQWLEGWLRPRVGYTQHGMTYSALYQMWGGLYRVPRVKEWHDAKTFIAWAAEHSKPDTILIHKDREKPIGPDNAYFGTHTQAHIFGKRQSNNTSGKTGVCWANKSGKWLAYIKLRGTQIYLGYYVNFDDAVEARLAAEEKYHKPLMQGVA
jgi:predicted DNA-binding transcriptional regulator AlpA